MPSPFDLSGRVAFVTGGNGGIGLGMARGLAEAGATLVIAGRNAAKNAAAVATLSALSRAEAIALDVTDEAACRAAIVDAAVRHGRLDILVNNAGIPSGARPEAMSTAEWHAILDTNLTSAMVLSQAAHPVMKAQGGGKVINVASVAAVVAGPTMGAYSASKAGLTGFTRACAVAWGPDNIQVNAVLPGWIDTDMTKRRQDDAAFSARILDRVPAGRWGRIDDFAAIAVFLAGPGSDFVTGSSITVDGGYSIGI
ncbi:SDR family NAD(P)-dependent oxidoreductase [Falsiroseomonas sp. HW251]|uniref:SDR family NAD(P)-dependent oxidoreductase n=1 Tax=Falsiroseomonas sp. HW251 TaxID=3390998 RepID=UPI003D31194C